MKGRGVVSEAVLDSLLETLEIDVVAFDADQASLARGAYSKFGKGQGHPAQLNFGDTLVYALAAARAEVLAYVGNDFGYTDLAGVTLPKSA